jgi:hypothetical protein
MVVATMTRPPISDGNRGGEGRWNRTQISGHAVTAFVTEIRRIPGVSDPISR